MGVAGTLYVAIKGDTKDLKIALKDAKTAASESFTSIRKGANEYTAAIGTAAIKTAAFAGAAGLGLMGVGLVDATKKASDLAEATGKFNVVFGSQQDAASKFVDTLTTGYGQSTREARTFLGSIQDLLVPMGVSADKAAGMSFEIAKLSTDLGSFNNQPTAQVLADIQSALVGSMEPMMKYGVVMNAATIEQKAMSMGLIETKDDLTASIKAQTAYQLIVEASSAAIGDFSRTSDGAANQQKILSARFEDLQGVIGSAILPAVELFQGKLIELAGRVLENRDAIVDFVSVGVQKFVDSIGTAVDVLRFFENGWLGVKLAVALAGEGIVKGVGIALDALRMLLAPVDAIYDGMVKLGLVASNPFDDMVIGVGNVSDAMEGTRNQILSDIDQTNAKYDTWKQKTDEISTEVKRMAANHSTASVEVQKDINKTAAVHDTAEKSKLESTKKRTKEQIKEEEKTQKRLKGVYEDYLKEVKFADLGYSEFRIDEYEQREKDLIAAGVSEKDAHDNFLKDIAKLETEQTKWLDDENKKRETAVTGDGGLLSLIKSGWASLTGDLSAENGPYSQDRKNYKEAGEGKVDDLAGNGGYGKKIYQAFGLLTTELDKDGGPYKTDLSNYDSLQSLKEGIVESGKTEISKWAGETAQSSLDAALPAIGKELGAWMGLGAGKASSQGDDWMEQLGNAAAWLAGAIIKVQAGKAVSKEVSEWATGGWISRNPNGGVISEGSGIKDDVLLGQMGNTINMGMGGEFVINKKATRENLPLLFAINEGRFAEGGLPGDDPVASRDKIVGVANDMNGVGFGTFLQEWVDTGNWKEGAVKAAIYYAGAMAAMAGGKEYGPNLLADGGLVIQNNGLGALFREATGISIPGADIVEDITSGMSSGIFAGIGSYLWTQNDVAKSPAFQAAIDSIDAALIPFVTDVLTPNKPVDFGSHASQQIDEIFAALFNSDTWNPDAKAMLDPAGTFDMFENGTNYVKKTGPAILHQAERVVTAEQNQDLVEHMKKDRPMNITVMVGNEEFNAVIDKRADNIRVQAERRNLGTRPLVFA